MASGIKHDLSGLRFGALVIERRSLRLAPDRVFWDCLCDCGIRTTVRSDSLRRGLTASCGCKAIESARILQTTHGLSRSREYRIWRGMIARCGSSLPRYGGRGISICEAWRRDFATFLAAMGPAPSAAHSIDRIDNDGNYEPGNCRWATATEQQGNKSNSLFLTRDGVTLCATEWARRHGIGRVTFFKRVRIGWDPERALLTPVRRRACPPPPSNVPIHGARGDCQRPQRHAAQSDPEEEVAHRQSDPGRENPGSGRREQVAFQQGVQAQNGSVRPGNGARTRRDARRRRHPLHERNVVEAMTRVAQVFS